MPVTSRHSLSAKAPDRSKEAKAINPNFILVFRLLVTIIISVLSFTTAIIGALVVHYYDTHHPIVYPSWASLVFLTFLGFGTPALYFAYNILLPMAPFINYGDFLYGLFMVKIELLLQFGFCVTWVSAVLAYDFDLGGYQTCKFDGYYHFAKPADFGQSCHLINLAIPFAYATFGVQVFLWLAETFFAVYTFLYLDQEVLSEPHFAWGRRAYDFQQGRAASQQEGNGSRAARATRATIRNSANDDSEQITDSGSGSSQRHLQATSQNRRGSGRRGMAYQNEMAESQTSLPASLGSRGRQAYADGENAGRPQDEESGWHLRG